MKKIPSEEEMKQVYFSNVREEMTELIPAGCRKILDVGCSEGFFGERLRQERKCEVWGIEPNPEAAALASRKLDKVITGDFISARQTLPSHFFDCIVFNDVLEHMMDPGSTLSNCRELLIGDGYVVSSIPNVRYIGNLVELLFKRDWEYKSGGILDRTHYRFFTEKSIRRLFLSSGYEIISCSGINPTHSWKTAMLGLLTFGFFSDVKFLEFATVAKRKPD